MATILIPTPLRKFTDNQSSFQTKAATVREAILDLTGQHQQLSRHLLNEQQEIRSFIRIYVGEDDIQDLQRELTSLGDDTVLSIVPAIAGGNLLS
jgi:molybdopterin synthase sulfur carrier subunit